MIRMKMRMIAMTTMTMIPPVPIPLPSPPSSDGSEGGPLLMPSAAKMLGATLIFLLLWSKERVNYSRNARPRVIELAALELESLLTRSEQPFESPS